MILFNTTFILDPKAAPEMFLEWANRLYIPAAMASPGVKGHTMALVNAPHDDSRNYAIQFVMEEEAAAAVWETTAEPLRHELEKLYGHGHVVWFSTYMDVISHSWQPGDGND
ncbi:MAG: DUF4286 family protein [Pseudoflavonifractor sp.]|nr:DUF4286 family protein [Alloprevotella sp.]MCM1117258.1 DUF4286 family protein [Pseudoflavonifractor sp.]